MSIKDIQGFRFTKDVQTFKVLASKRDFTSFRIVRYLDENTKKEQETKANCHLQTRQNN